MLFGLLGFVLFQFKSRDSRLQLWPSVPTVPQPDLSQRTLREDGGHRSWCVKLIWCNVRIVGVLVLGYASMLSWSPGRSAGSGESVRRGVWRFIVLIFHRMLARRDCRVNRSIAGIV